MDLPTVMLPLPEIAQLKTLARMGLDKMKANVGSLGSEGHPWIETSFNKALNMHMYQCDVGGGMHRRHKAVIDVPYAPRYFLDALLNDARRLVWDGSVATLTSQPIGTPEDCLWLQHGVTKGVYGVSPRDFVNAVSFENLEGGGIVHGGMGIEEHPLFPQRRGVQRALNLCGVGWHLLPIPPPEGRAAAADSSWTRVSYIIHTDLRGWLPQFVINAAMGSTYAGFFEGVLKDLAAQATAAAAASPCTSTGH